ncbi:MAG: hypothetical protein J0L97_07510 [Alphaproteobacteria bacterium]|nr:hypothetical protein [Alphaproteobacteria bacterium]
MTILSWITVNQADGTFPLARAHLTNVEFVRTTAEDRQVYGLQQTGAVNLEELTTWMQEAGMTVVTNRDALKPGIFLYEKEGDVGPMLYAYGGTLKEALNAQPSLGTERSRGDDDISKIMTVKV